MVASTGYPSTLANILDMYGLTLALPVMMTAAVVGLITRPTTRAWLAHLIGLGTSIASWFVCFLLALLLLQHR